MTIVADRALEELRTRILRGDLRPGERLVERTLCAEMDMSRTPVREALRALTAEGLVTTRPHCGMVVADLDPREIEEIFEFGVVLEGFIASLAARKARPADCDTLRDLVADMQAVLATEPLDPTAYLDLDQRFHEAIAGLAGNPRLASLRRQTLTPRVLTEAFTGYGAAHYAQSLAQHGTIVQAIAAGDADWAASAMRSHILTGRGTRRSASEDARVEPDRDGRDAG